MVELYMKDLVEAYEESTPEDKWLIVEVQIAKGNSEFILVKRKNFDEKMAYYKKAYNDNLTLKSNPDIQIVDFHFVETLYQYFLTEMVVVSKWKS